MQTSSLSGEGDELYGIEASSYYTRNLFLTMSISWPLAVAAPVFLIRKYLYQRLDMSDQIKDKDIGKIDKSRQLAGNRPPIEILFLPAIIWLCVLFSRPHKEERFLYPIYPMIALMAAYSMSIISHIFSDIVSYILEPDRLMNQAKGKGSRSIICEDNNNNANNNANNKNKNNKNSNNNIDVDINLNKNNSMINKISRWGSITKQFIFILCLIITSLLSCSRSVSNYSNFSGIWI
jgi:hypothetical protein